MAGAIAGQLICSSVSCRNMIGILCQRGTLVAVVEGIGVYQCDVERARAEWNDRNPGIADETTSERRPPSEDDVIANFQVERLARSESVSERAIDREVELTQFPFHPKARLAALHASGLSARSLRCAVAANLRTQAWIEKKLQSRITAPSGVCEAYYGAFAFEFRQPLRLRASHIFFAAPAESDPEVVETKRQAAKSILDRIAHGEKFEDLVVESEDEESKKRGGDLNFFSESRMPPDFWNALKEMPVGGPAKLVQTRLGFHVVTATDSRPAKQMPLEEACPIIITKSQNATRQTWLLSLRKVELWNRRPSNLQIP